MLGLPRLRECCGQAQAVVVSNIRNKILQTWEWQFSRGLYWGYSGHVILIDVHSMYDLSSSMNAPDAGAYHGPREMQDSGLPNFLNNYGKASGKAWKRSVPNLSLLHKL